MFVCKPIVQIQTIQIMKTFKLFPILALAITISTSAFSQDKNETINVAGECGMCKTKIEKAAKSAGASFASWNTESKVLTVKYSSKSTNAEKIQQAIAGVGYDTPKFKATEEAYNNLHECCKYDRGENKAMNCCAPGSECCKDGKCTKHEDGIMACCKDGKCTMHEEGSAACCKDGKCSKEGHSGKACCKKS